SLRRSHRREPQRERRPPTHGRAPSSLAARRLRPRRCRPSNPQEPGSATGGRARAVPSPSLALTHHLQRHLKTCVWTRTGGGQLLRCQRQTAENGSGQKCDTPPRNHVIFPESFWLLAAKHLFSII